MTVPLFCVWAVPHRQDVEFILSSPVWGYTYVVLGQRGNNWSSFAAMLQAVITMPRNYHRISFKICAGSQNSWKITFESYLYIRIPSLTPTTRLTLLEILWVHRVFYLSRLLLHWYLKPCNQSIGILLVVLHQLSEALKCLLIIYCVLIVLVLYVVVFNLAIMAVQHRDKSTLSYWAAVVGLPVFLQLLTIHCKVCTMSLSQKAPDHHLMWLTQYPSIDDGTLLPHLLLWLMYRHCEVCFCVSHVKLTIHKGRSLQGSFCFLSPDTSHSALGAVELLHLPGQSYHGTSYIRNGTTIHLDSITLFHGTAVNQQRVRRTHVYIIHTST